MSGLKQNTVITQLDFQEIMDQEDVENLSLALRWKSIQNMGGEDSKMHAG